VALHLAGPRLHHEPHESANAQSFAAQVAAAADAERRRLERDLHHGAQQRLVALAIQLTLLSRRLDADSETKRDLDAARAELAGSLVDLRELAHGLSPSGPPHRGLAAAVESTCA
jgi:signal transduction histidine kinase